MLPLHLIDVGIQLAQLIELVRMQYSPSPRLAMRDCEVILFVKTWVKGEGICINS